MKAYVKLLGDLREALGKEGLEIELQSHSELKWLIEDRLLGYEGLKDHLIDPKTNRMRTDLIILINDRSVEGSTENERVRDGDIITLAPAIAGG